MKKKQVKVKSSVWTIRPNPVEVELVKQCMQLLGLKTATKTLIELARVYPILVEETNRCKELVEKHSNYKWEMEYKIECLHSALNDLVKFEAISF